MAKKKGTNTVTLLLLGLLVMGLAGFGVTNFGGSARTVATVGDAEVGVNDYARAVEAQVRRFEQQTGQSLTMQQALAFGFDRMALGQLVTEAALENEAGRIGISAGDVNVSNEIRNAPAFQGLSGSFDRQVYEDALRRSGISVESFERRIRSDVAEGLLRRAVSAGVATPDIYVDTLFAFARETRDITWARLTAADLKEPLPEPTEEELSAFHAANPDLFTRPETKAISFAWLTPDMLADGIDVDEAQARALYEERIGEFVQPERRLVERLVFGTEAQATEAKARLDAGEVTFDDLVAERGLDLSDVDMGDVGADDLGAAGEAVFALEEPGTVGPMPSDLGPALFRMNGILAAQETPFEEVREELEGEAAADRARRMILDAVPQVEDMLAGGADMALLAERTDMEAGSIEWNEEVFEGIAAYDAFREAAARSVPGDFPEVVQLEDGGIVVLKVDEVRAPELRPLDEVREAVAEAWSLEEGQKVLEVQAEDIAQMIRNGREMAALDLNLEADRGIGRDAFLEGTPPDFTQTVFQLESDEVAVLAADGDVWIVRLDAINVADGSEPEAMLVKAAFAAEAATLFASGITNAYTQALVDQAGVELNQAAMNAVTAQLQ